MSYLDERLNQKLYGKPIVPKKQYSIPKKSAKKIKQEAEEKERLGADDSDLVKWYKAKMKVMGTKCNECGATVEHKVYQYAINSICHILAKRDTVAPSVKYHPANFIILCPFHHDQLDKANWKEIEQWGCWQTIQERLLMLEPDLALEERRFLPESVLTYIEKNDPFNNK